MPRSTPEHPPQVWIFTRRGCHLCDDVLATARSVLAERGWEPEIIDVDTSPELRERYGMRVPVVVIDGKEISEYHLSERRLRRALGL